MAKANKNKFNKQSTANKASGKTSKQQSTQSAPTLSSALMNHLASLNITTVKDLSDYYSKIGVTSSNNIDDISNYTIDTSDQNLVIIDSKKAIKEFLSKNDILYGIILRNNNDPDNSILNINCCKKTNNSTMTIQQLYTYLNQNMATKQDLKNLENRVNKKINKLKQDNNLK